MPFYDTLISTPPVIDFEASSLDPDDSYPISVGLTVGGHSFEWIIKPQDEWKDWSEQSQALHGYCKAYVIEQGLPAELVCQQLMQALKSHRIVYSDAADWDMLWALKLGLTGISVRSAGSLVSPEDADKIGTHKSKAQLRYGLKPHNAMDDSTALAFAIQQLQRC